MNEELTQSLLIWIFQAGEPLHIDGGSTRPMRAINLSDALAHAGHRVVLWSSTFYHQEKRHRSNTSQVIKVSDSLEIRLVPSMGYQKHIGLGRLMDHAQLAFNLKKMLHQADTLPDVAFIGYPPIETAAVLTRWLTLRRVPSLLDVKDQWPSLFMAALPKIIRPLGYAALLPYYYLARRAMRDVTGLSAMANGFLDWALDFSGRERTVMDGVFPLTFPIGQVSASQLDESRQWWDDQGILDDGRTRVCFVGSISPSFDFKPLLEAAKIAASKLNSCEFVICGDGGSSNEIRSMMADLQNVHFPGWVNRPKIAALAERCQAALAPYHNRQDFCMSLPNKIIDALSFGLPILSPLRGEVASLISEHAVGMRYGTDTGKTLHDCIVALTQDAALQKSMSKKARALYAKQFSFENVYGRLVKHLEMLASRRKCYDRL
ncbi:MAG: glycosyltransferase [Smithella sp.]